MAKRRKKTTGKGKRKSGMKLFLAILGLLTISLALSFAWFYERAFGENLNLNGKKSEFVYIKTDADFNDVVNALTESGWLENQASFVWMAEFMKYDKKILPGRYRLKNGMSNREIVSLLRSGKQEPLNLTLRAIRTKEQLAGKVGRVLEADSLDLIELFNDSEYMAKFGLNDKTALCLFMPDTYEFYWNTSAETFIERMASQYDNYWSEENLQKAKNVGLKKTEVQIIASIVVQESNQRDEWPIIAGVYINRFRIGMALQADPTVKFALGDFDLRRIRSIHTSVESPYNTYKYKGLPPGPIYMTGKQSMDAVLNYQSHNYLYFCARPDRSGYHSFSKSFSEHQRVARQYHRSLNQRGL
ncbi:MAG: endolytic transglycosylase MltG [Bacteroidia bacterium]